MVGCGQDEGGTLGQDRGGVEGARRGLKELGETRRAGRVIDRKAELEPGCVFHFLLAV